MAEAAAVILGAVNLLAFIVFGLDKKKAEKDKWRVPESTLIMLAVLGGSAGALAGMLVFRHKTRKAKFMIGIPVILLIQVIFASLFLMSR